MKVFGDYSGFDINSNNGELSLSFSSEPDVFKHSEYTEYIDVTIDEDDEDEIKRVEIYNNDFKK